MVGLPWWPPPPADWRARLLASRDGTGGARAETRVVEGWDSFKQLETVMASEERFKVKFTSSEVDGFLRLGDLVAVVAVRGES